MFENLLWRCYGRFEASRGCGNRMALFARKEFTVDGGARNLLHVEGEMKRLRLILDSTQSPLSRQL